MKYKKLKLLIIMIPFFWLTGCWDYVGLDDITIVTGVAIDKDFTTNEYLLSYEIISLSESSKQQEIIETTILESTGRTIMDAFVNAKKRVMNKLYFGDTQTIIISNQIAKIDGINTVIDIMLRGGEIRETVKIIMSGEKTAKELLLHKGADNPVVSNELNKIVKLDNNITSSTKNIELFEVFNILESEGSSLMLPVFNIVRNDGKNIPEVKGMAVFSKDKLIGELNPNNSKSYLFIMNEINGGVITIDIDENGEDDLSLEIMSSKTSRKWNYKDKRVKFIINIITDVNVTEFNNDYKEIDTKKIKEIEKMANEKIITEIEKTINYSKENFKTDIFGFGNLIYQSDPNLWKKLKDDWNNHFQKLEIKIKPKVNILNTNVSK
ncbi:MAG: Ger(x)C family spore germination protein [Bacilli bacterium]|nr:Ger(x)C family spore germination protein [Bacilli bacterium]MDD4808951.1 Ger(x)C family spore germination protein [Bacilli bacterium]